MAPRALGWLKIRRLSVSRPNVMNDVCYGTLLSREQYLHDVQSLKYRDGRETPAGSMTREEIEIWTRGIEADRGAQKTG